MYTEDLLYLTIVYLIAMNDTVFGNVYIRFPSTESKRGLSEYTYFLFETTNLFSVELRTLIRWICMLFTLVFVRWV